MISSAFAAEAAGAAHHGAEPFYAQPEFWVAVGFFAVVAFAIRPVGRAIVKMLDDRSNQIKERIEESIRLREEAQEMLAAYERKQRDALKEAEDIIARAQTDAKALAEKAAKELEASLERRRRQAMERIALAEAQAVQEVREKAVEIAVKAAEQAIVHSMTPERASLLIDDTITEMSKKLH